MQKIYYTKFEEGSEGYTTIKLKGEKVLKTLTLKQFLKLANKNDYQVNRGDIISIIEELILCKNQQQ